jgi:phospholipid/cholesterol/gamma-HCH transport system substrate-binding protein
MMSRTKLDLWVGLFVALGIAALIFLAMKVGNFSGLSGKSVYTVEAPFDNIGGLKVRAPVKSSGVVVGRVAGIRFDAQHYRAVVRLELDGEYQFPRDTIATIGTSGLLGEQYVGLEAGGDIDMLANGDTLAMTQSAIVLEKLISQFMFDRAAETPAAK